MNGDQTSVTRITNNAENEITPSWNPAGSAVVFAKQVGGVWNIYKINANGSGLTQLTTDGGEDPTWSPDGTKIAYYDYDPTIGSGVYEVMTMNADGTNKAKFTLLGNTNKGPSWFPNSNKIIFVSNRDGNFEIYTANLDRTSLTRLTNTSEDEGFPSVSPDGTKIAYDRGGQVWVMNADGSGQTKLTSTSNNYQPVWSQDSRRIIFTSNRTGEQMLFTMNADGTSQTRLTGNTGNQNTFASWIRR